MPKAILIVEGDEIARGLALGANAYITKPFNNDYLIARVNALLENTVKETGK